MTQSTLKLRPLIAGNWKMNGLRAQLATLRSIAAGYDSALKSTADLLICPPSPLLYTSSVEAVGTGLKIGAQDCHPNATGAHTGDVSAEMIADAGASFVILGHSERRQDHGEKSATVAAKVLAAWRADLTAIVCVGETKTEREAGKALTVVRRQLRESIPSGGNSGNLVIAYEPVWAIGTGLTPTNTDVTDMHTDIRAQLKQRVGALEAAKVRILYGGSVKPSNAAELLHLPHVNGALVGGASLNSADFLAIVKAAV
jgi:triosephosphate isomerase (TIM)